jgi:S1-C subfamily serine protease
MRIDGVSEGKAAQRARLKKGDIIVQLGDSTITNMMSYMRALSIFKEGDKTSVVVKRGEKEVSTEINF